MENLKKGNTKNKEIQGMDNVIVEKNTATGTADAIKVIADLFVAMEYHRDTINLLKSK